MHKHRAEEFFPCPHCGADVPVSAQFCRECGADERSGWSNDADDDYAEDDPEDDFDYDDFVRREFPDQAQPAPKNLGLIVIVLLLCLGMLSFLLRW